MARFLMTRSLVFVGVLTLTALLGCGGSTDPTGPSKSSTSSPTGSSGSGSGSGGGSGPGGGSPSPGNGSLAINITDSPFSDAKALLVTFSDVKVHNADGDSWQTIPFASGTSRTCDLKKLQGPTDVLGVGPLPAGHYTQIRLVVSSANIYFTNASTGPACAPSIAAPTGSSASVDVPSGEVILNRQFTITTSATTMLLDFDGDQSIKQTGNGNSNGRGNSNTKYIMTPVIAIVSVQ